MDSSNLATLLEDETPEQQTQRPVSAFASKPDRPPTQSSLQKYSPLDWSGYFDREDDINIPETDNVFHVYIAGTEGPVVFCLHGGGYSGLSFALAASKIKEKARVVAMDLRGHGKTVTENDVDLSIEGTAMASLIQMQKILSSRMQHFSSFEKAIEWSVKGGSLRNVDSARVSIPSTLKYNDAKKCYTYRARLEEMEQYWRGWYEGLSDKYLSCPVPKLLLLAGTDRLDRALTIGQMQGKFQMVVVRHTGHAIQEDVPEEFSNLILNFISRNRIGPNGIEIPGLRRPSQSQP